MPLFSLNNVRFKNIIQYPYIEISEGRATFISGESGCGKSTLLRLLNGIVSADSGEILYQGTSIDDYDPIALRREVLLCGQSAFLFDGSIQDNFAEYYKYRELPPVNPVIANACLKTCVAEFPLSAPCVTMSGGEKHRVFVAICLSFLPKVLLLDEPTGALDDRTANRMMENIKAFCKEKGISLIVVSHSKALMERFADDSVSLT